jgi:hypothetical protein
MKRTVLLGAAIVVGWLGLVSACQAQVFIRAPFVRVGVGDGVYVRAPFVNLYVPSGGPAYGPRVVYLPPPIVVPQMPPASEAVPLPQPRPIPIPDPKAPPLPQSQPIPIPDPKAPPPPIQAAQVMTLDAFAKSFQPKAGSFETTIINPVTNQPTTVRFLLPEGSPRRVVVTRDSIEFIYRIGQWVRIDFDREGAKVTSR